MLLSANSLNVVHEFVFTVVCQLACLWVIVCIDVRGVLLMSGMTNC